MIICFMFAISTCLFEKYFASTNISANFAKSTGCNENDPKVNLLLAPLTLLPSKIKKSKKITEKI